MGCLLIILLIVGALFGGTSPANPNPPIIDYDPLPTPSELAVFAAPSGATSEELLSAVLVIEARLNALGIVPDVTLYEGNAPEIHVLLPGGDDLPATLDLIQQRGYLELVDLSGKNPADYEGVQLWTTGQAAQTDVIPNDTLTYPVSDEPFTTILDSDAIATAELYADPNLGSWGVLIELTRDGTATLAEFTAAHIGEPLAIVLDGEVLSIPIIQSVISDEAVIQGDFTEQEARYLAAQIGSGALPIPMTLSRLS